jgi:hypothetical protein
MTVAPTAFAVWNAAIPTLLDAAVTMTKSPAVSFGLRSEAAPRSDILHPGSGRLFERDLRRMFDEVASRHIGHLSIGAPPGYVSWRNQTDNIAFLEAGDGCANRFHDARSLEPEAAGKLSLLQISVRAEHDLRPIQADALYIDLDFVGTWRRNLQTLDFQYACITIFVEANGACHRFSSISVCIFVHATRRVSQLSAILLHQEQAGEIAKTQLLCVRMSLPRSEQEPWQSSSKLGGCSFARACVYCAVEKLMHQRPNPIPFFFQCEMPRIEKIELRAGNISFKEFSTRP